MGTSPDSTSGTVELQLKDDPMAGAGQRFSQPLTLPVDSSEFTVPLAAPSGGTTTSKT